MEGAFQQSVPSLADCIANKRTRFQFAHSMDSFRHQIQLPLNGKPFFSWPTGAQEPQHSGKRKLEPDANEVVERLNGFVLSPNTLKRLRTEEVSFGAVQDIELDSQCDSH